MYKFYKVENIKIFYVIQDYWQYKQEYTKQIEWKNRYKLLKSLDEKEIKKSNGVVKFMYINPPWKDFYNCIFSIAIFFWVNKKAHRHNIERWKVGDIDNKSYGIIYKGLEKNMNELFLTSQNMLFIQSIEANTESTSSSEELEIKLEKN